MPKSGIEGLKNTIQLKLNMTPSFLFDVVREESPDIIHGHFGLDSYRLIRLRNKTGLPLVVNFYGHDVIRLPREFGWKQRYERLNHNMEWAVAVSEDMRRNLVKLGFNEERISVIKLAVDMDNIEFKHRKSAGPRLMMVGRCVEKKGFIYAFRALNEIRQEIPDVTLDLYGNGELLTDLKKYVNDNELTQCVTFHGFTDNEDIFKALYNHDVLLVPSVQAKDGDREGLPQTTVEGMATGIPVIASDHAGLPELVIDEMTGLQVPTRNSDALKRAVIKLYENPELAEKISEGGRRMVEREHDLSKQVKKTEQLYSHLI
jgi:glycosyltransferase involved in cell wall biosynthesis